MLSYSRLKKRHITKGEFMEKKKFHKPLLFVLSVLTIGSAVGGYFVYDKVVKGKNEAPNVQADIEEGSNFRVKYSFNASTDKYGSYEITYKVEPNVYTDQILAKISYIDDTDVDENIISIVHLQTDKKVIVHCKDVFTKQVKVTLYAETNPEVNCMIKFDFVEKLKVSLPEVIDVVQGETPKINVTVDTTGGTKEADKIVRNETYAWNQDFVDWCMAQGQAFLDSEVNEMKKNCEVRNASLGETFGLTPAVCLYLFQASFNATSFLSNIGVNFSYEYRYSDDDDPEYSIVNSKWCLKDISYDAFRQEFNGENKIIDYTCSVNRETYASSLGLRMEKIPVSKIIPDTTSFTF